MSVEKVKMFLDGHDVRYLTITHSRAFTAQEAAASADIPGREMAKTVMVKVDGRMAMAVLPAPYQIDFYLMKKALAAGSVELAEESEFGEMFSDCEVGAMPPFGNLYGMEVYVDEMLTKSEEIVFNAGSLIQMMKMDYSDFERLVEPVVLNFAMHLASSRRAA